MITHANHNHLYNPIPQNIKNQNNNKTTLNKVVPPKRRSSRTFLELHLHLYRPFKISHSRDFLAFRNKHDDDDDVDVDSKREMTIFSVLKKIYRMHRKRD